MPEEPEVMEEQTREAAPEPADPEARPPEAAQEAETAAGTPEEAPAEEEKPPKERRSLLLPVLYVLVALLIIAEGFVVYAWWAAVSEAQTAESLRAAREADRSNLSGTAYSNRYGSYRPNSWPDASAIYVGGASGSASGSGRGQVVDSQEPAELTGPVMDLDGEPENGG